MESVHLPALAADVRGAVDEHEELVTRGSLVGQLRALFDRQLVGDACDLVELTLREPGEEGDALDQLDFCVLPQHRSILRFCASPVKARTVQFCAWPETPMR